MKKNHTSIQYVPRAKVTEHRTAISRHPTTTIVPLTWILNLELTGVKRGEIFPFIPEHHFLLPAWEHPGKRLLIAVVPSLSQNNAFQPEVTNQNAANMPSRPACLTGRVYPAWSWRYRMHSSLASDNCGACRSSSHWSVAQSLYSLAFCERRV